jgi:hypothetical protein
MSKPKKPPSWRDKIPIHPAAQLFPLMSEPEQRELGEDIIKRKCLDAPIVFCVRNGCKELLDGRNRLDGMEAVGIKFDINPETFEFTNRPVARVCTPQYSEAFEISLPASGGVVECKGDPCAYVISANLHLRHLTSERKRELLAKLIKGGTQEVEQANRQDCQG